MWRRRARTIFTMIGVIIGSFAIFVIVSIGNGFEKYITDSLTSMGDINTISIYSYQKPDKKGSINTGFDPMMRDTSEKLDDKHVKSLTNLAFTKYVDPKISYHGSLEYKKYKSDPVPLTGSNLKYVSDDKVKYGKVPKHGKNEIILGYYLAKGLINEENPNEVTDEQLQTLLRKKIKINILKQSPSVSSENESVNPSQGESEPEYLTYNFKISAISLDNYQDGYEIKMPMNLLLTMAQKGTGSKNYLKDSGYSSIDLVVKDQEQIEEAQTFLRDSGYIFQSFQEMQKTVGKTLNVVKLILAALGSISLLVAAFGIVNTMNMAIYERKKEIGIMKVIGASIRNIKSIFLGEASAIGFIGGLIGLLFGFLINLVINAVLQSKIAATGSTEQVKIAVESVGLIAFVLLFATLIGFLSGLYPANKAAKLDVISSIKDE